MTLLPTIVFAGRLNVVRILEDNVRSANLLGSNLVAASGSRLILAQLGLLQHLAVASFVDLGIVQSGLQITAAVGFLNHASMISRELAAHVNFGGRAQGQCSGQSDNSGGDTHFVYESGRKLS